MKEGSMKQSDLFYSINTKLYFEKKKGASVEELKKIAISMGYNQLTPRNKKLLEAKFK